jgi:hypothetical protein
MKTVLVNEIARKKYFLSKFKRENQLMKIIKLNDNSNEDKMTNRYLNFIRKNDINRGDVRIKLEIELLKEGDVFGIRDLIFTDYYDLNPVSLVSDGVECILVEKKQFARYLNEIKLNVLKITIMPYPNEEYFLKKYFEKEDWSSYRKNNFMTTIERISLYN